MTSLCDMNAINLAFQFSSLQQCAHSIHCSPIAAVLPVASCQLSAPPTLNSIPPTRLFPFWSTTLSAIHSSTNFPKLLHSFLQRNTSENTFVILVLLRTAIAAVAVVIVIVLLSFEMRYCHRKCFLAIHLLVTVFVYASFPSTSVPSCLFW